MRRRRVLATLGSAVATLCAGCGGRFGGESREYETLTPAPVPTGDGRERRVATATTLPTVGRPVANADAGSAVAAAPERAPPERFADLPCPPLGGEPGTVLCYHRIDPSAASLSLGATAPTVAPDGALAVVLVDRGEPFTFNPQGWRLLARSGGSWETVERGLGTLPLVTLDAGEAYTWRLAPGGGPAAAGAPSAGPASVETAGADAERAASGKEISPDLGPGPHAFAVDGVYGARRLDTGRGGRRVVCVAPFRVASVGPAGETTDGP